MQIAVLEVLIRNPAIFCSNVWGFRAFKLKKSELWSLSNIFKSSIRTAVPLHAGVEWSDDEQLEKMKTYEILHFTPGMWIGLRHRE